MRIATLNPSVTGASAGDTSPFRGGRAALVRNDTKGGGGPPRSPWPGPYGTTLHCSLFPLPSSLFPFPSSLFPLHSSLFTLHFSLFT